MVNREGDNRQTRGKQITLRPEELFQKQSASLRLGHRQEEAWMARALTGLLKGIQSKTPNA